MHRKGDTFEAALAGAITKASSNPARVNPKVMRGPYGEEKYWRNLPETQAIAGLVQEGARARMRAMIEKEAAMPTRRDPEKKAVAAMAEQDPKSPDPRSTS